MKTTKNYPKTNPKVARQTSSSDSMTGQREPGTPSQTVGPDMSRLPTFKPLVVSTYNVHTLHQKGKSHQLFMCCNYAGVDIVGIQEHRLITSSPTEELWSDDKNGPLSTARPQTRGFEVLDL